MGTKVFFCEETDRVKYGLRVYESIPEGAARCPASFSATCHNAHSDPLWLGEEAVPAGQYIEITKSVEEFDGSGLWPTHCPCGHEFTLEAQRQVWKQRVVRRIDTGEEFDGYRELPVGAIWNAWWCADHWHGDDGRCLVCKLPDGHEWMIDSRASNCTMPEDKEHRCWVRHGRPEDGTLHVDKNGRTCAAGAGSIATPKYHGFLHNGELTSC